MYKNNMRALQLSGTTAFSSRTKHICTRYHFLRELVASNKIIVSHVKTTDQLADIFTKFLDYPRFKANLDKIINFASWATLQDHQHLHHHLYWGACVCFVLFLYALYVQRLVYVSDFLPIYTHFKSSLFAISTRYTPTWVFWSMCLE